MPPGAKKRKALKKKMKQQQQQQASITNNKGLNGDNLHGHDEHGSQDDRESDSSLSSPGSQGNEEFCRTKDPSAAIPSGLVKDTAKEISGLGPKNIVEKSCISSNENSTQTSKNVASQDSCGNSIKEISHVVDSVKPVSKVVISEKSEYAETSTHSNLVKQKSVEIEEYPSTTLPGTAAGTSRKVLSVRESDVPVSSEEKRLLLPGPPAVRTSWLSCCGLFEAMTGSDR